jgi:hypothetical protein
MRVYFILLAVVILALSLAFAQGSQGFSNPNATNQNATSQNATGLAANLIELESLISKPVYDIELVARKKPVYDIESFTKIKPVYNMSMVFRTTKPVFDVNQRVFLPARFSYTMITMRPTYSISQRGGQLNIRFINNAVMAKPFFNMSAYSAMKPFYEIGQSYRIKPIYPSIP